MSAALKLMPREERGAAIDRLVAGLEGAPFDDDLHAELERWVPDHPLRQRPWPVDLPEKQAWFRLAPHLPDDRAERGYLLYGLPELGRVDARLLEAIQGPGQPFNRQTDCTRLTVTERLGEWMPLHAPTCDDYYRWSVPVVRLEDGALYIEQSSRYDSGYGPKGYEDVYMRVYRVRGSLFHARRVRFYWWDE